MSKGLQTSSNAPDYVIANGKYRGMKYSDAKIQLKKDQARQFEYDMELIQGRFRNLEQAGRSQTFSLHVYPNETIKRHLEDGELYEIPRMLARFINEGCYYWRYKENNQQVAGLEGDAIRGAMHDGRLKAKQIEIKEPVHRFAFIPTSFNSDDIGLGSPSLTRVEIKE